MSKQQQLKSIEKMESMFVQYKELERRLELSETLLERVHSVLCDVNCYNEEIFSDIGEFLYNE